MSDEINKKLEETAVLIKQLRDKDSELEKKYDGLLNDNIKRLEDVISQKAEVAQKELNEKMAALEVYTKRQGESFEEKEDPTESKKFNDFIRRKGGQGELEVFPSKALVSSSNPDGGYVIKPAMSNMIVQQVYETSPMRQVASIETISTNRLQVLIDTGEAGADWGGELQTISETTTPQLGMENIDVHKLNAYVKATDEVLADATINLESWLARKVTDKFSRLENTAFLTGNGVKKPRGILGYSTSSSATYTNGTLQYVASGIDGAVTADGFIRLQAALKAESYHSRAIWAMTRGTFAEALLLKDGIGNYLLNLGLNGKGILGYTILQKPVQFWSDMDAVASNAYPVVYGDFSTAYLIVDRAGITILRDPYSAKTTGQVEFMVTKRVGGAVVNFEAIKLLKCSVS